MKILVDTNILVRLVHIGSPLQDIARRAIKVLEDSKNEVSIVPQVLYEFWSVATRPDDRNGLGFFERICI